MTCFDEEIKQNEFEKF